MVEKNVASGINTANVNASEITKVVFERAGVVVADFYHVRNDGDTVAYASVTDSTLTAGGDGVMSIPSGTAVTVGKGLQIYVKGNVTIVNTSIASNPFKVGAKGGESGGGYSKAEVDERLSQPIINATTLTGEGLTVSTVDNVARVDMVGGKSTTEWATVDLGTLTFTKSEKNNDETGTLYFINKNYGSTITIISKKITKNTSAKAWKELKVNEFLVQGTYIIFCYNVDSADLFKAEMSGVILYYKPSSPEYAQLLNCTPTTITSSTGASLSLEALTAKYFPTGMGSNGEIYDELNFAEKKAIQRIDTDGTVLATPIITPITESIDTTLDTVDGGTLAIATDNPCEGVPYKITEGYEYPIWKKINSSAGALPIVAVSLIPQLTSNTGHNGTASSNISVNFSGSNNNPNTAYYAFDNNMNTNVQYFSENVSGGWVMYEFTVPHTIASMKALVGVGANGNVFSFMFQYWNGSEWKNYGSEHTVTSTKIEYETMNGAVTASKVRIISNTAKVSQTNFMVYDFRVYGE